jgi:hypothetical protein
MTYAEDMIPSVREIDADGNETYRYLEGDELVAYELRKRVFEELSN